MNKRLVFPFTLLAMLASSSVMAASSPTAPTPRIVGGEQAEPESWPYMSALVSTFDEVNTQLSVNGVFFASEPFNFGPAGTASGEIADCGLAGEVCTGVQDKVCLIERGEFNFSEKANNCEAGGGIGAIIYNNDTGAINGTMGEGFAGTIPVVGVSRASGLDLLTRLGQTATVTVDETLSLAQDSTCGATFLGDKWVLTAAHCVDSSFATQFKVNVGEYNLADGAENAISIANIYLHPEYDVVTFENDIAILELTESSDAPAVKLASSALTDLLAIENSPATVIGWGGRTGYPATGGETSNFPDILHQVELQLFTNQECRSIMSQSTGLTPSETGVTDTMICAGVVGGGRSSCQGDSGGPLLVNTNGGWQQVGIVSWGRGCAAAGHPGVFTRAGEFSEFIRTATEGVFLRPEHAPGTIPVGSASLTTITVLNNSDQTVPVNIAFNGDSDFSLEQSGCTDLAPGNSCSLDILFSPQSGGEKQVTLSLADNLGEIASGQVNLYGLGIGQASSNLANATGVSSSQVSWFTGGDAQWQTSGVSGVQSGAIDDLEQSILIATVSGEGTLSFQWSVSSEENTDEPSEPYDALYLFVNGELQDFISGEVAFATYTLELGEGTHIVEWNYNKDSFTRDGDDRAYVRNVSFTPVATPTPTPNPPTSNGSSGGGSLSWLLLLGLAGILNRRIKR